MKENNFKVVCLPDVLRLGLYGLLLVGTNNVVEHTAFILRVQI